MQTVADSLGSSFITEDVCADRAMAIELRKINVEFTLQNSGEIELLPGILVLVGTGK